MYATWRKELGTVNGSALQQLPQDAVAAILLSKPGSWVKQWQEMALETTKDRETRDMMRESIKQSEESMKILDPYTGECGVCMTWNSSDHIGIVACGETASASDAVKASDKFTEFFQKSVPFEIQKEGDLNVIPFPEGINGPMKTKPCWQAKDRWVRLGMHPVWMKAADKPSLQFPRECEGRQHRRDRQGGVRLRYAGHDEAVGSV